MNILTRLNISLKVKINTKHYKNVSCYGLQLKWCISDEGKLHHVFKVKDLI